MHIQYLRQVGTTNHGQNFVQKIMSERKLKRTCSLVHLTTAGHSLLTFRFSRLPAYNEVTYSYIPSRVHMVPAAPGKTGEDSSIPRPRRLGFRRTGEDLEKRIGLG